MEDQRYDDVAAPLDRRALLKKGAAAGLIGAAAPTVVGSFFSPAAAASCASPINADLEIDFASSTASVPANSAHTSGGFTAAVGRLVVISFTVRVTSTAVPTVTVTAAGLSNLTQAANVRYVGAADANPKVYQYVYTGVSTTAASQTVAITFSTSSDRFAGQIVSLGPTGIGVLGTADTAIGTYTYSPATPSTQPTITLSPAPDPSSAQLVVFAHGAHGTGNQVLSLSTPTGFTELSDASTMSPNPGYRLAIAVDFDPTAQSAAVTTVPESSGGNVSGVWSWGAVALELGC